MWVTGFCLNPCYGNLVDAPEPTEAQAGQPARLLIEASDVARQGLVLQEASAEHHGAAPEPLDLPASSILGRPGRPFGHFVFSLIGFKRILFRNVLKGGI